MRQEEGLTPERHGQTPAELLFLVMNGAEDHTVPTQQNMYVTHRLGEFTGPTCVSM